MPTYVYQCPEGHRVEKKQRVKDLDKEPVLCEECAGEMHRVPQPFRFYHDPTLVLYEKMDEGYRRYRAKREARRAN